MIGNDLQQEIAQRVEFIRCVLRNANAQGIVFGNSGGKDSALTGILCKMACENTLGVIMPCQSKQNFLQDKQDAEALAKQFGIATKIVDLTQTKQSIVDAFGMELSQTASSNIAPRLRMTTLYAIAANENRIVAGTGNRCEAYMGYFTKWGDGAFDFNPIADLTVSEIYALLTFLNAPQTIINKAPSAGLFDGQTDEKEMGVSYRTIEKYLRGEEVSECEKEIIERYHKQSVHKREQILLCDFLTKQNK
ncbi:MAG: NAD(+) synthase [Bacteroidales bacterium]|jgi:NAD+ synthase|nr:NAD(+) synthase [Bacteroidales bacterium]